MIPAPFSFSLSVQCPVSGGWLIKRINTTYCYYFSRL
ncbi:hypothetical protein WN944_027384 [Citrus x changshan-huyou]|uniref:Uncharacterized protein n=1 Tax=Citrus x changshan-huyou TaxID=2935761 RepID=A0AAP0LIK0_9ROSI